MVHFSLEYPADVQLLFSIKENMSLTQPGTDGPPNARRASQVPPAPQKGWNAEENGNSDVCSRSVQLRFVCHPSTGKDSLVVPRAAAEDCCSENRFP